MERDIPQRKRSHSLINDEPYLKKRRAVDSEFDRVLPALEPKHSPSHSTMAELYPDLYSDTLGDDLAALEASQIRPAYDSHLNSLPQDFRLKGLQ